MRPVHVAIAGISFATCQPFYVFGIMTEGLYALEIYKSVAKFTLSLMVIGESFDASRLGQEFGQSCRWN